MNNRIDKSFLRYQEKQRDGDFGYNGKGSRQERRELQRRSDKFYLSFICKYGIELAYWNNIDSYNRDIIISRYYRDKGKRSFSVSGFIKWIKSFKVDRVGYRNDKLKSLGI